MSSYWFFKKSKTKQILIGHLGSLLGHKVIILEIDKKEGKNQVFVLFFFIDYVVIPNQEKTLLYRKPLKLTNEEATREITILKILWK